MRHTYLAAGVLVALLTSSCGGGGSSTEQQINSSLDAILQSAVGGWTGTSSGTNPITLDFTLQAGSNGQVSGTGTMKEANAATAVPITVSGTYQRPVLSLVFNGMVYESQQVQGTVQGSYTTVGGISATLKLTGAGYARDIPILLQEKLN